MTYVIPEIGISYELIYYEKYAAGIRVTYSLRDNSFTVKADSKISREHIEKFLISKSNLFAKWTSKIDEREVLPLPDNCKSITFKNKLMERCMKILSDCNYDGPRADVYKIAYSKSYWGRCSADKVISISCYCHYLTDEQLHYVLMHEHAHLIHMNHKTAFWNLVELYCPDYKNIRQSMKEYKIK